MFLVITNANQRLQLSVAQPHNSVWKLVSNSTYLCNSSARLMGNLLFSPIVLIKLVDNKTISANNQDGLPPLCSAGSHHLNNHLTVRRLSGVILKLMLLKEGGQVHMRGQKN